MTECIIVQYHGTFAEARNFAKQNGVGQISRVVRSAGSSTVEPFLSLPFTPETEGEARERLEALGFAQSEMTVSASKARK